MEVIVINNHFIGKFSEGWKFTYPFCTYSKIKCYTYYTGGPDFICETVNEDSSCNLSNT